MKIIINMANIIQMKIITLCLYIQIICLVFISSSFNDYKMILKSRKHSEINIRI